MRCVLPPLAALCLAFAPAPRPARKAEVDLLEKLQGNWAVLSVQRVEGGRRVVSRPRERVSIVNGRQWVRVLRGVAVEWTTEVPPYGLVLDARKSPARLEVTRVGVPVRRGVIRLDKDTLKFCYATGPDAPVPSGFDRLREGQELMTLRRLRP